MEKGTLRTSKLTIVLYVIAAAIVVYGIYSTASVVSYINTETASYDITMADAFNYIVSTVLNYFVYALLIFVAAVINNGVRALNPANYLSEAEVEAKEAEKAAKNAVRSEEINKEEIAKEKADDEATDK
ncbi:MAG: hypothetical protein JJE03_07705 [Peptostreptococcaceae bacterium]|nr:hypothetical protein [Peptostreptococcaceae bacterium]